MLCLFRSDWRPQLGVVVVDSPMGVPEEVVSCGMCPDLVTVGLAISASWLDSLVGVSAEIVSVRVILPTHLHHVNMPNDILKAIHKFHKYID